MSEMDDHDFFCCGAEESGGGARCTFPSGHMDRYLSYEGRTDLATPKCSPAYVPLHSWDVPVVRTYFLASGRTAGEFVDDPNRERRFGHIDRKTFAAIFCDRSLFEPFETCNAGVDGLTACWLPKGHEADGVAKHSWEKSTTAAAGEEPTADLQEEVLDAAEEPYVPPDYGFCRTCGYALHQKGRVDVHSALSQGAEPSWDTRAAPQRMYDDARAAAFEQALLSASAKIDELLVGAREVREDALGKILSVRTSKLVEIVNALRTNGGVSPDAALSAALKLYDDLKDSFREMLAPDTYTTHADGTGLRIRRVPSGVKQGIIETELRAGTSNGDGLLNLSSVAPHFGATIVKPGI